MRKLFRNQNKQITQNLVEKHNSSSHRALSDMKCKVLVAKWKMTAQQKTQPLFTPTVLDYFKGIYYTI